MLNTCWNWDNPKAHLDESRCRSQVTIPQPKTSSCSCLMSLVLTVLMPALSMSRGDNSPTRRFTEQTSILRVFVAGCPRRAKNENLSGGRPSASSPEWEVYRWLQKDL